MSLGKHNFDFSSNNNSKVSGPLRESELLDFNRKHQQKMGEMPKESYVNHEAFMQSQERRLPLSKISSENSGPRVTNGIGQTHYANEDHSDEYVRENETFGENQDMEYTYGEYEDEPEPKQSAPTPHQMTNYKEVRDQKKWMKVNSGLAIF